MVIEARTMDQQESSVISEPIGNNEERNSVDISPKMFSNMFSSKQIGKWQWRHLIIEAFWPNI
jgi:hypothetical protein